MCDEFVIDGNFNLQMDTQYTATSTFKGILPTFDLKQNVSFSIHIHCRGFTSPYLGPQMVYRIRSL